MTSSKGERLEKGANTPDGARLPPPGPVSDVRALLVSFLAGLLLGGLGAWLVTVAWFVVYGGDTPLDAMKERDLRSC